MSRPPLLEDQVVDEWLAGHASWHRASGHLVRELDTPDYATSIAIVNAQVTLAEALDHHPVVTLGYWHLRFELWTHDRRGLTELDLFYAQGLDELVDAIFNAVVD